MYVYLYLCTHYPQREIGKSIKVCILFFFSFKKDEIDVVVEVRVLILYDSSFKVWKFYFCLKTRGSMQCKTVLSKNAMEGKFGYKK